MILSTLRFSRVLSLEAVVVSPVFVVKVTMFTLLFVEIALLCRVFLSLSPLLFLPVYWRFLLELHRLVPSSL